MILALSIVSKISIGAHRQRLSNKPTHQPPAAAVGCCRGSAASHPQSTRRGQALTPPCAAQDHRSQNNTNPNGSNPDSRQAHSVSLPPLKGFTAAAGGRSRQKTQSACPLQPNSRQTLCHPISTKKTNKPGNGQRIIKTSALRRARCFGFGRLVALQRSANGRRWPLRQQVPPYRGRPLTSHHPPVPKALRPPLHLSKRPAASAGGYPLTRYGVRPPCGKMPQAPSQGRFSADGAARVG